MSAVPDLASHQAPLAAAREEVAQLRAAAGGLLPFLRGMTRVAARALATARVGVWLLVDQGRRLAMLHQHDQRAERGGFEGVLLEVASFPSYFRALESRPALVAPDAMTDARLIELRESYLGALGIGALLDVPLVHDGTTIGVMCHAHLGAARDFSTAEIDFALCAADALTARLDGAARGEVEGELKRLDALTRELELMAGMMRLASGLGHDLNNLFTVIAGNVELLEDVSVLAETEQRARRIRGAVAHGRLLAESLIVLGRRRPNAPRVVRIAEHMARRAPFFEHDGGSGDDDDDSYRLTLSCSGVGAAMVDLRELDRITHELMLNARARVAHAGVVHLAVCDRELDGGPRAGSWVMLEVSDEGPALDGGAERWFEPFADFDRTPSRLGLPIVKHLVTRAGGFVELANQRRGAAVRVHFPRVA